MALVDNTKFHINKENMTQKNMKMGKDLEEKMQTRMNSNVQPIKSAVSFIYYRLYTYSELSQAISNCFNTNYSPINCLNCPSNLFVCLKLLKGK